MELLIVSVGDPWNPNKSILGSAGQQIVHARPPEEWTKARSRPATLNLSILERQDRTLHCLGCGGLGPSADDSRLLPMKIHGKHDKRK